MTSTPSTTGNETTTTFAVVAGCMSNSGARAKSLGRRASLDDAKALADSYFWSPLGNGPERSRGVIVFEYREMGRKVVYQRDLD